MDKILITGGAGFVGSHVIRNLFRREKKVTIFDRHIKKPYRRDCNIFLGDVKDKESVFEAVYHHDGIIHFAALLGTQETISTASESVAVNIMGSLNIFDACKLHKKKAVYIGIGNHWMNNSYSITKEAAERFALMYNKEFGTEIVVVRGLNAYGPHQKSKPVRKIMPNFILPAIHNEPIFIYGNGKQVMDMIYVADLAEILVRALLMNHGNYDTVIEAGAGKDTTVNEIAECVIGVCNSKSAIVHLPMRPGEIPDSTVKADTRTLECLDYPTEQMIPLVEGIKRTVNWYTENQED